jgi:hypothetical protein
MDRFTAKRNLPAAAHGERKFAVSLLWPMAKCTFAESFFSCLRENDLYHKLKKN